MTADNKERTENRENKSQLKYAQQHLANERTYLAWIRTAIAIVGIGFLTTSLHFTIGIYRNSLIDIAALVLGLFACFFGICMTILAAVNYARKRRDIFEGNFNPMNTAIMFVSILMMILIGVIIVYFLFVIF